MVKNTTRLLVAIILLSGCAQQYRVDGQTVSGTDQFQAATDTLYRDTQSQLVSTMRVAAPISKKSLIVGLPTVDAIKGGFIMPNPLLVTPAQLIQRDTLSKGFRGEYEMFAATVKGIGIYQDVKVVDTTGGHLQPSSTESVLYMYVVPEKNAYQWYMNGGKTGLQAVNIDRGQPQFLGKATSYVNSVKAYALTD